MQILTAAEMGAADRKTAAEFGVPAAILMENAGAAVARFCLRHYAAAERVTVLCGKGNNGGDGMVAARVLAEAGVAVEVVLLGREDEVKGEAAELTGVFYRALSDRNYFQAKSPQVAGSAVVSGAASN